MHKPLPSIDTLIPRNAKEVSEISHVYLRAGIFKSRNDSGHCGRQIDRQSALQSSQRDNNDRIPFTLTFHPHNHAVKSINLKIFKLLQNDPDSGRIFSQPPLISEVYSNQVINPELLNALAHDAKHVLTFAALRKYRDPSDRSRSLIISPVPQPMSSTA